MFHITGTSTDTWSTFIDHFIFTSFKDADNILCGSLKNTILCNFSFSLHFLPWKKNFLSLFSLYVQNLAYSYDNLNSIFNLKKFFPSVSKNLLIRSLSSFVIASIAYLVTLTIDSFNFFVLQKILPHSFLNTFFGLHLITVAENNFLSLYICNRFSFCSRRSSYYLYLPDQRAIDLFDLRT